MKTKNTVKIIKDDEIIKTLVLVNGEQIEEKPYDFNADNCVVCLKCGNEFDVNGKSSCECGEVIEVITYREYMETAQF